MPPLLVSCALLCAAGVLVGAQPAATAEAALKSIWGPTTLPDGSSAFPVYERLGVDVRQQQLSWRDVALLPPGRLPGTRPTPPTGGRSRSMTRSPRAIDTGSGPP